MVRVGERREGSGYPVVAGVSFSAGRVNRPWRSISRPATARRMTARAQASDGHTVAVVEVPVRLQGVAALEVAHPVLGIEDKPGGPETAAFLARLVNGRTLICTLTGERSRSHEVGVCRLDGQDVGAAVIAARLARDCPRFRRGRYARLETEAGRRLKLLGYCESR